MEMYSVNNSFNGFGERCEDRVLSRFVIGSDSEELDSYLCRCKNEILNSVYDYDLICLGSIGDMLFLNGNKYSGKDKTQMSAVAVLEDLVMHAEQCKKLISKKKCKSLIEYNRKCNVRDFCRTIVVIPSLDKLLESCVNINYVKENILKLLKLEKFSGISVVVCATCENPEAIDFPFINSFLNRILFKTYNNRLVENVSLGMYNSTNRLDFNQYYYFDYGGLNGMMLSV